MRRLLWFLLLATPAWATVTTQGFSVSYVCTGTTGPFAFSFSISDPTALTVTQNGNVLSSSAYVIVPVNNNYDNGGTVTLNSSCPSNQSLVLTRITPLTQGSVFQDNMPVPMKTFENGLDKLTEISQEIDAFAETRAGVGTCPTQTPYVTATTISGVTCSAAVGPVTPGVLNTAKGNGAAGNTVIVLDGNMTSGQPDLTTTSSTPFTCPGDVGKAIVITGAAGTNAANHNLAGGLIPMALASTIATCVSSSHVTIATNAAATVANQWTAFGTDDTAAIRACVNKGGTCYLDDGVQFMVSNTNSTINIGGSAPVESQAVAGFGTVVFAPQGSIVGGTNDRFIYVQSAITNNTCTSGGTGVCAVTNAPIAKGATTFTVSSSDGAQITAGQWIIIEETFSTSGCCNYIDWAVVKSLATVGGTTTVTLTQPLEMAFPADTNNSITDVVGIRPVNNLASHVTLRDFTVYTPMMYDSVQGRRPNTINTQGSFGLTIQNVKCFNAAKNCLATDYDYGMKVDGNQWGIEGTGTEIASTVHAVITNNTFGKQAYAINQKQSGCAGGTSPSGLNVDLATAYTSIDNNQIDGCQVGVYLLQGAHANTVTNNKIGWLDTSISGPGGVLAIGTYDNRIIANTAVGATSGTGTGITVEDSASNPLINSNRNQVALNEVGSSFNTAYSMTGSSGTDCYVYLSAGDWLGTCVIAPTQANAFTAQNTFNNGADSGYNPLILQGGKTASQVVSLVFNDYNNTQEWMCWEKDSTNGMRCHDTVNSFDWMQFIRSSGQTVINSRSTNNVLINGVANSGSGGLVVGNGTASSNVFSVDGSGNITTTAQSANATFIACFVTGGKIGHCTTAPSGTPPTCGCTSP